MALNAETIEAIRRQADIVAVIGLDVALRKQGRRYLGLCPFHGEKTPSFSVSSERGLYYCFGCHAGGDVFSFVMRHHGLDFGAAVRLLAQRAGIQVDAEPPEVVARRKHEDDLARANSYALAFFEHALWSADGAQARAYLSGRGVPEVMAREWNLGWGGAPGALVDYLRNKRVPPALAEQAGFLADDTRRGLFDYRVVFPIHDAFGKLAGFGGRRLGDSDAKTPKYINTRESQLFSKRRLLFGWQKAEDTMRRSKRVVLVEGYLDVLACHRAGITGAVAALGTSFTDEHARACARFAKEIVLLFDADAAGARASQQAAVVALRVGLKVLVAPLTGGKDPDALVAASGTAALAAVLDGAVSAVEYLIDSLVPPGLSIEERSRAAEAVAPALLALPSGLERDLYTARLAERVGVSAEQMAHHLRQAKPAPKPKERSAPHPPAAGAPAAAPESAPSPAAPPRPAAHEVDMLRELLLHPQTRPRLGSLAEYTSDPMRLLLDDLATSTEPLPVVLARHLDERLVTRLAAVKPAEHASIEEAEALAVRTLEDSLTTLKIRLLEKTEHQLLEELREAQARGEDTAELQERKRSLTRRKRELKRPRTGS